MERSIDTVSIRTTQIRARELANTAHGVAKSGGGGKKSGYREGTCQVHRPQAFECTAQEPRTPPGPSPRRTTWTTSCSHSWHERCRPCREPGGHGVQSQEITNTAWAFATAFIATTPFFRLASGESRLSFNSGLSNTVGFAKVGHLDDVARWPMVLTRTKEFTAQDLANIAWAYAKLVNTTRPFAALAGVQHVLDNSNAQGLANVHGRWRKSDTSTRSSSPSGTSHRGTFGRL